MFDFSTITQWVDELLRSFLPHAAATLVEFILIGLCLLVGYAVIALVLIYVERKVCAFFQCRIGPNRVGPYGTIQSVADMIKMLTKEIIDINHVDRFLFNLARSVASPPSGRQENKEPTNSRAGTSSSSLAKSSHPGSCSRVRIVVFKVRKRGCMENTSSFLRSMPPKSGSGNAGGSGFPPRFFISLLQFFS